MTPDIDEVAVERACEGDRTVSLNRYEMAEAVARHVQRGVSLRHSADLLGIEWRSIQRIRSGEITLPHPRRGVTVDNTKEKIGTALRHESPAVQRAAKRANEALATLDTLLAEWDAKELARERVAELEAELAKAKAALRGPGKTTTVGKGEHSQARTWAQRNGITVPDRGRVPSDVIDRWRQATTACAA